MLKQQLTWSDIISPDTPLLPNIYYPSNTEEYKEVLTVFKNSNVIAFDIETFGAESWEALYAWKGKIRSFQIGIKSDTQTYVIIVDLGGWKDQTNKTTKERVAELCEDPIYKETIDTLEQKLFDINVQVIGANLVFDGTYVRVHLGWIIRQIRDVVVLSRVLWGGVGSRKIDTKAVCDLSHSFKAIASRVGINIEKGFGASNWGWTLSNAQVNYQAEDVIYLFPVYERLKSLIIQAGCVYSAYVECQFVTTVIEMQYQGFPVDLELAEEFVTNNKLQVDKLVALWEECFPNISYSSNPQVLDCLNSKLTHKIMSVDKQVLNTLDTEGLSDKEIEAVEGLKKIRKLEVSIKYVQGILDYAFDGGTGRVAVRTQFHQNAPAGTGRTSVTASIDKHPIGVQLQNPAKDIRYLFRHTNPDKVLFTYDASGSHMRIAAQYAADYWSSLGNDPSEMLIVKIFRDDFDGHSVFGVDIANRLFGKNWTEAQFMAKRKETDADGNPTADAVIAKFCREKGAKPGFYSCINGAGWNKNLSTFVANGFTCDVEDAKYITSRLEYHHPGLLGFIKSRPEVINSIDILFPFVDRNGNDMSSQKYSYVQALTGRRQYLRKYPKRKYDRDLKRFLDNEYEVNNKGEIIYEVNYTNSIAAHWLLVESDVMKEVAARLQNEFHEHPEWGAVIFNMVHDEFNGECNVEYKEVVGKLIQTIFRECFSKWVKIIPVLDEKFEEDPCCGFMASWDEK
jgi:DNA polymerase I-like protein with 3'-5' exonuclease and polymerase domains